MGGAGAVLNKISCSGVDTMEVVDTMIFRFTVLGNLPDLNKVINLSKTHWANYHLLKKSYTEAVYYAALEGGANMVPRIQRAKIKFTWYCPNRRIDPDNISHGCKYALDGIVATGLLAGDSWNEVVGIAHEFEIDKDEPRVEIELEEVE